MDRTTVLLALALGGCTPAQASQPPPAPAGHYCNLGVFTPEERAHLEEELVPKLAAATTRATELDDGYAFQVSGQFKEAGEWLDAVRRCCPTIAYDVAFSPQRGPATMKITGGAGAKEFIREEFAPLFRK
jgi:hypothetical protein